MTNQQKFRLAFLGGLLSVAVIFGGITLAFYVFLMFGIGAGLVYTCFDLWDDVSGIFDRPKKVVNYNQNTLNLNVEADVMKGQPDPTGPEAFYPVVAEIRRELHKGS